jgi:predicted nucleic acid-binding protein
MALALADSDPGAAANLPLLRGAAREVMFDTNQRQGLAPSIPGHRPLDSVIGEEVRAALDRHGLAGEVLDGGSGGAGEPLQVTIPLQTVNSAQASALVNRVKQRLTPVGRFSALLRITYTHALLERLTDVLPACDLGELGTETSLAREALGQPWSVDLSAAYVAVLLSRAGVNLLDLGKPAIAHAARLDAYLYRDAIRTTTYSPVSLTVAGAGSAPLTTVRLEAAIELDEQLEHLEARPIGPLVAIPNLHPSNDLAWASSVQLAKEENRYLYADDVALRRLATAGQVRSFGTVALVRAALVEQLIDEEQAKSAFGALRSAAVVALPSG